MNPDVVVIGGGIVGCSCAYYLARAGMNVRLLEKGPLGAGASKAGMFHVVTWEEPDIHLRLASASKKLYQTLAGELPMDIEFRITGSIAVLETIEAFEGFQETARRLREKGVECDLLDQTGLAEMEPNLAPDLAGGAHFPADGEVNPLYATWALAEAAQDHGAVIDRFTEVTDIEVGRDERTVETVQTASERIPTKYVVNAAGAWSGKIGEMVGLEIPVTPRKGHLVVTVPVPDDFLYCKILLSASYMDSLEEGIDVAVAANVQQARNGNLLLGSSRQFVGFDRTVEPQVISLMVSRCIDLLPSLEGVDAIRTWSGLRPYTPDLLPIIGPVAELEGFYMASGHEGIGITEGPITGKLISQMLTGEDLDVPIDGLSLSRFASHGEEDEKTVV